MSSSKLFIVDGNAYLYKCFYGIRGLSSPAGVPTNSIYGFCNIILKLLKEQKPEYFVVCFDSPGPTHRMDLDPEYKANRSKMPEDLAVQLPYIDRLLAGLNIPVVKKSGIEADDIIATIVDTTSNENLKTYIVAIDKDLCQLITGNICMFDPSSSKIMNRKDVIKKHGVPPERFAEMQALLGDTSDNISGVKGIGRKTAAKLLTEFESLDDIYENLPDVKNGRVRTLLENGRDSAYLSLKLTTLMRDVSVETSLDKFKVPTGYGNDLIELFDELGFDRFKKILDEIWLR